MRRAIQTSLESDGDLAETYGYLALHSGKAVADMVVADIYEKFIELAGDPSVGHRRDDLSSRDLWFSKVHSYLVVYSYTQTHLKIIAVLHMARDAEEILRDRT